VEIPLNGIIAAAAAVALPCIIIFAGKIFERSLEKTDQKRTAYILDFEFPASILEELQLRYPAATAEARRLAIEQLRVFFLACKSFEGQSVGMPSKLVDAAWHSFILSTRSYSSFCNQAFGKYLHHTPDKDNSKADALELGRMIKGAKNVW
jgi:hypothetical protein